MNEDEKNPADQLIDLLVYAPLGLALEFRTLMPELAERGRRQLGFARSIGKMALGGLGAAAARDAQRATGTTDKAKPASDTKGEQSAAKESAVAKGAAAKKSASPSAAKKTADKKAAATKKPAAKKTAAKKPAAQKTASKKPAAKKTASKKAAAKKTASKKAAASGTNVNEILATYDTLTARNIVGRLEALKAKDLRTVRDYESANRGRVTILNRIDELLA